MKIGLIARADNTGLGNQTWEFARHMEPAKVLVVDLGHLKRNTLYPDRYPDATVVHGFPDAPTTTRFLDGLDVVFTCETPYSPWLFSLAPRRGVKTVLQYNYEFLDPRPDHGMPTLLAAPSTWHYDDVDHPNKILLPVPIALDRFPPRPRPTTATHFLHVTGKPAVDDRNGTGDLLEALRMVRSEITVTITCQEPNYVQQMLRPLPANVRLSVQCADVENYWDLYRDAHALVMPRRFGGLCLPVNEALGAGMPVIMPDVSPNNDWLPREWLVPAIKTGELRVRRKLDVYSVDHRELAAAIDRFATDRTLYARAADDAATTAKSLSWDNMRPVYERAFEDLAALPA